MEGKKMSDRELAEKWEQIQKKTFTKWINSHLMKRGEKIDSLLTDLRDGVKLIHLLEVISEESIPKYNKNPKMIIQRIENLGYALKFIKEHKVELASIGAEAIERGDVKLTLGMIWTIILRFAIAGLSEEGLSAKQGLLLWCQRKTEPYDNVDIKDFSGSFQDGLAFCALIHRHRPDLLDYSRLTKDDALGNLNLAFDVAYEHLSVPKLLDAEDVALMPRPDERSVMTYVAQLYNVFAAMDQIETAGRRIGKFVNFAKTAQEMVHDYEQRTRALNEAVHNKVEEFHQAPLGDDYHSVKEWIGRVKEYKRTQRREFFVEQADLATLFGNIQAKLKSMKRPPYVAPEGLRTKDVEANMENLTQSEKKRSAALNAHLRSILDQLRQNFAKPANAFAESLMGFRAALVSPPGDDLRAQLTFYSTKAKELAELGSALGPIQEAERACDAANIEENEYCEHTYDDLSFEHEQLAKVYNKKVSFIESQIAAEDAGGVSAEQLQEFKESFDHFDEDKDGLLSRLEFKSCLSGLGLVKLDFEGGDKVFEDIFKRVANGGKDIHLDQYTQYMVSITADSASPSQLSDSFKTIAAGKDFITAQDMKTAQLTEEQISFLSSTLPPKQGIDGGYDHKAWLSEQFGM